MTINFKIPGTFMEYILKILEHQTAGNSEVKKKTSKIERMLGEILSRPTPPPNPSF